jgi:predicted HAD superfamily Cof-like phosphohydrolase
MSTETKTTPSLINKINSVKEFHEVFGIGSREKPEGTLDEKEYMLRYNLMKEENDEYLEACKRGDLVEIADALGDKMYILFGSILKHGLQHKIEDVFDEIHRSNMSKLDENGKPIYREDGKILKSKMYFRPDIKAVLERE